MPDLDTRQPDAVPAREQSAPVRRSMEVGAADDHAELDADRRADAALSRLAGLEPVGLTGATGPAEQEQHVHTAACGIGRSHAPAAEATIGYEGGRLDTGTQSEIEGAVGGGEGLAAPLRSAMEGAFGRDLGKVRIHRDDRAARISRKISAEAFTTGNDIFFGAGAYDPGSAKGQKVLAHELGHVVQGGGAVHRFWNPFKKKAAAPKPGPLGRKDQVEQNRAEMKVQDKQARAEGKKQNAVHAAVTAKIKLTYDTDPTAKLFTPVELVDLQKRFEETLALEKRVRASIAKDNPELKGDELDAKQDEACEGIWDTAGPDVRALRPMRFDHFDKALREVAEMANLGRGDLIERAAGKLDANERNAGAPMTPEEAKKQVLEERALGRRKDRAQSSQSKEQVAKHESWSEHHQQDAVNKTGNGMVGPVQSTTLKDQAKASYDKETFGKDSTVASVQGGLGTGGEAANKLGTAVKGASTGLDKVKAVSKDDEGSQINSLVGSSTAGLGELLSLVSSIIKFITHVDDMRQGTADEDAGLVAVRQGATTLNSAAKVTKATLEAAKEGVQSFGGMTSVIGEASHAIPIVGLVSASLGSIDNALTLISVADRHSQGVVAVEEAVLARKAPLAASYDRVNSRTAQLIEKSTFDLGKNLTMLGLSVAEVATAGGFGVPAAAKLTLSITGLLHTVGHKIYDTVKESQSSTALSKFKVEHQDSASRDVLKYDVGSSVDVIIVAAKKHGSPYAIKTLNAYGIKDNEIQSMWLDEIREKVLDFLGSSGDPKTVGQKVTAAKDGVKEALGIEKAPTGMEEDVSVVETITAVPGKIYGALKSIGPAIGKKIDGVKEKFADARQLVAAKNSTYTSGRDDRGKASTLYYAMRGGADNEKSLAKTRAIMKDRGTEPAALPRSSDDRKKRAEMQAARDARPDGAISQPLRLDQAFVKKVLAASAPELFDIIKTIDDTAPVAPIEMAKLRFLEMEVEARITQPEAVPMPGARKG